MPQTKEQKSAYDKARYAVNKEERAASSRAYYAAHKEERAAYRRDHSAATKEERAAHSKAYRAANKERLRENKKAYWAANRERLNDRKEYWAANKERQKAASAKWYQDNKERMMTNLASWKDANPNKMRWIGINSRARQAGCQGTLAFSDLLNMLALTCGYCPACDKPFSPSRGPNHKTKWSFDHVKPIELGGEHSAANGQIICVGCNNRKGHGAVTRFPVYEREAAPGWKQLLDKGVLS